MTGRPARDREPARCSLPGDGSNCSSSSYTVQRYGTAIRWRDWSIFRADCSTRRTTPGEMRSPSRPGCVATSPVAIRTPGRRCLTYRSSQPISYPDALGGTAIDTRYAGTMTFRGSRPVSYGAFDDVQTYTYTAPGRRREKDGRFAREAVGFFRVRPVPPHPDPPPEEIAAARARLAKVAPEFLPINTRPIFIADQ